MPQITVAIDEARRTLLVKMEGNGTKFEKTLFLSPSLSSEEIAKQLTQAASWIRDKNAFFSGQLK